MKISIVLPLYNKRTTVLRSLNSVLSQTVKPEEIIVINDGSTDGSEEIVKKLNHPLIRLIDQPNSGVSAARNRGIAESKGDWIAFLDADDEWLPGFLNTINLLSEQYPDCSVLGTSYFIQNIKGEKLKISLNRLPFKGQNGVLENYFEIAAYSDPPINSSAITIKKSALESINCFPVGINSGEDLITWAKLAAKFRIAYSVDEMSVFIQYENSNLRIPQTPDIVSMELQKLLQTYQPHALKKYISIWHKMRAKSYLALGQKQNALKEIRKSIRSNLLSKAWNFLPFVPLKKELFNLVTKNNPLRK